MCTSPGSCVRGLGDNLRFSDSLEGLTESRKTVLLKLGFITVKGYTVKSAQVKGT